MNDSVNAKIAELRAEFLASPENIRFDNAERLLKAIRACIYGGWNLTAERELAEAEWDAAEEAWSVAYRAYREAVIALRATMK
jgi:hypothetical protein